MDLRWSLADSRDRRPETRKPVRRASPAVIATAVAGAVAAVPTAAFAEGTWTSSYSGVQSEYQTPRFQDNHADSNSSKIQLTNCDQYNIYTDLRRHRTALPDVSYGVQVIYDCVDDVDDVVWNPPTATGQFFFQHWWQNDSETLKAQEVFAAW